LAAPTTSFPEVIGGVRNWDYRYSWMRDAAFTVYAFLRIGFRDEAAAFLGWLEDYASKHARRNAPSPVMFTIEGEANIPELTLDHWEVYGGSRPVRIGNLAVSQFQGDIYGELMDALYLSNKYVSPTPFVTWMNWNRLTRRTKSSLTPVPWLRHWRNSRSTRNRKLVLCARAMAQLRLTTCRPRLMPNTRSLWCRRSPGRATTLAVCSRWRKPRRWPWASLRG